MQFMTSPVLVSDLKSGSYKNSKGESKEWFGFCHRIEFDNGDKKTVCEFIPEDVYKNLSVGSYYCFIGELYKNKDNQCVWFFNGCEKKDK